MAQSLVLWIDVCRGLGISPLRINIWLSFSQADLAPTSTQELFFAGFSKILELEFPRFLLIELYGNLMARIFDVQISFSNIAFPLSSVSLFQIEK